MVYGEVVFSLSQSVGMLTLKQSAWLMAFVNLKVDKEWCHDLRTMKVVFTLIAFHAPYLRLMSSHFRTTIVRPILPSGRNFFLHIKHQFSSHSLLQGRLMLSLAPRSPERAKRIKTTLAVMLCQAEWNCSSFCYIFIPLAIWVHPDMLWNNFFLLRKDDLSKHVHPDMYEDLHSPCTKTTSCMQILWEDQKWNCI